MNNDHYSRVDSIKIKAKADYKCQHCGSDDAIQAHAPDGDHADWRKGIALCGNCHADEHPDVPRSLFLSREKRPYWHNISARALAIECKHHPRTIIRRAKLLGIASNCDLSDVDKAHIEAFISHPKLKKVTKRTTIQVSKDTAIRLSELGEGESYDETIKKLLGGNGNDSQRKDGEASRSVKEGRRGIQGSKERSQARQD